MIWVIGSKGMLGTEVCAQLEAMKLPWIGTGKEVDVSNYDDLEKFTKSMETASYSPSNLSRTERQIKWIINCSAYTNVNKAEEEVELADKVNHIGPLNIARIARHIGAKLIHVSTDYVFDGTATSPYTENLPKAPLGVYGTTKAAGEDAIQKEMNTYYIVRTAWLYGFNGKNFVYTMTNAMNTRDEVNVVSDQTGCPTFAGDLASALIQFIVKSEKASGFFGKNSIPSYGIYHYTNAGQTTWYEFTKEIYELGQKYNRITSSCKINPCTTEDYPTPAKRPAYSVLSKDKITAELKIKIPDWKTSLEKFIKSERFEGK